MAEFLAKKNLELILTGRKEVPFPIDLSTKEGRKPLLNKISEKKPDLIINNAGVGLYGETLKHSIDEQLEIIEVNVNALVEITLHSAKTLIDAGKTGTILNISSAACFFPYPTFNIYAASKGFVTSFSLALDRELKGTGVRVLCACPGQIATNFRNRAAKGHPQTADRRTMSSEQAVCHLWKQIEKGKPLTIFGGKTRVMVWIARCLPRPILDKILMSGIKERFPAE